MTSWGEPEKREPFAALVNNAATSLLKVSPPQVSSLVSSNCHRVGSRPCCRARPQITLRLIGKAAPVALIRARGRESSASAPRYVSPSDPTITRLIEPAWKTAPCELVSSVSLIATIPVRISTTAFPGRPAITVWILPASPSSINRSHGMSAPRMSCRQPVSIMSWTTGRWPSVPASVQSASTDSGRSWRVVLQHRLKTC